MTAKELYAITRVLQSHYRKIPCAIYREAIDELVPLDRQAAVDRMARAILRNTYGGNVDLLSHNSWDAAREDARAALDALLGGGQS